MSDEQGTLARLRRPAFYAAVGLYTLAFLALPTRQVLVELVTAWLGEPNIHTLHDINGAAFMLVAFLGVLVQFHRPARRRTALLGTFAAWGILAAILAVAASPILPIPIMFLVLASLVALSHPRGRDLLRPELGEGVYLAPLALVAVAALPLLAYAAGQVTLQVSVADSHAADGHYALMAAGSTLILVLGLAASVAETEWRFPAWAASGLAIFLGLSSVVFPTLASSLGPTWGIVTIGWGVAFLVVIEGKALEGAPAGLRRRLAIGG